MSKPHRQLSRGRPIDAVHEAVFNVTESEDGKWGTKPIEFDFAISYLVELALQKQIRRNLFWHFSFAIIYLVMMGLVVVGGSNYYANRAVEGSVALREVPADAWVTNLKEVANTEEWNDWFSTVVIPSFYDYLQPNETLMRQRVEGTDAIPQGPMRVRIVLVLPDDEGINTDVINASYMHRYPRLKDSDSTFVDKSTYVDSGTNFEIFYSDDCSHGGMSSTGMAESSYPCGGHVVDFLPTWSYTDAMAAWQSMKEVGMIDSSRTRVIEVMFYAFVPTTNRYISVLMQVEFSAGGSTWVRFNVVTVYLINADWAALELIAALALVIFVMHSAYSLLRQFSITWSIQGNFFAGFADIYNYFELTFIGLLAASLILYIQLRVESDAFNSVAFSNTTTAAERFQVLVPTTLDISTFNLRFWNLRYLSRTARDAMGFTALMLFFRSLTLFRAFRGLNWITRVFERSASQIGGVLLVFLLIVAAFAQCGVLTFGHAMPTYRSLPYAFESVMLLVLGERFDYQDMRRVHPTAAVFFFWGALVLGLFLLLNFVMALLGEAFDNFTEMEDARNEQRDKVPKTHTIRSRPEEQVTSLWGRISLGVRRRFAPTVSRILLMEIVKLRARRLAELREEKESKKAKIVPTIHNSSSTTNSASDSMQCRNEDDTHAKSYQLFFTYNDIRGCDQIRITKQEVEFSEVFNKMLGEYQIEKKAETADEDEKISLNATATTLAFVSLEKNTGDLARTCNQKLKGVKEALHEIYLQRQSQPTHNTTFDRDFLENYFKDLAPVK